ncbi:MAG TPA: hypothetical protein VMW47_06170 [Verrucomicrobiae bacterium]|nr:hypothetical protein [Verrucomicrobiae bacterium]
MRARPRGRQRGRIGGLWLGAAALVMATAAVAVSVPAAVARTVASPGPAFACRDTLVHTGGRSFRLTSVLGATRVSYQATLARGTGLPMASGGTLVVANGARQLTLRGLSFANGGGILASTSGDQLCALRFGHEAYPEVLLQPYTGGAHCCFLPTLYTYSARARGYRLSARATLTESNALAGRMPPYNPNGGLAPELVGGHLVLLSSDGRFPYTFACFACSAAPILLLGDLEGRFVNVTRLYPTAVAADARTLWSAITGDLRTHTEVLGVVPAWVADECTLGRAAPALIAVARLERAGDFSAKLGPGFDGTGAAYVRNLRRFLSQTGYCR